MKGPQNNAVAVAKHEAADDHGDHSDAESEGEVVVYPSDILSRINALKNLHIESQRLEQEMHKKMFMIEAETYKKLEPILKKRAEIVAGVHEPSETEGTFKLKDDEPAAQVLPPSGEKGIPKFWATVLSQSSAGGMVESHDHEALEYLKDIRAVYTEKPLGFKLEFEFTENPFFSDSVLSMAYEFEDTVSREDLYVSTSLSPKSSTGSTVNWKDGKNLTKKVVTSFQRNKKTNERRQIKNESDQESFFKFFHTEDLSALMKPMGDEEQADQAEKHMMQIQAAEERYEIASTIRTHVLPKALLIFTGEDDDDNDFDDEDDYDEDEDDEDEEGAGDNAEEEDDESDDDAPAAKKGGKQMGNNRGPHAHGPGCGKAGKGHRH